jgi:hypothetical protein
MTGIHLGIYEEQRNCVIWPSVLKNVCLSVLEDCYIIHSFIRSQTLMSERVKNRFKTLRYVFPVVQVIPITLQALQASALNSQVLVTWTSIWFAIGAFITAAVDVFFVIVFYRYMRSRQETETPPPSAAMPASTIAAMPASTIAAMPASTIAAMPASTIAAMPASTIAAMPASTKALTSKQKDHILMDIIAYYSITSGFFAIIATCLYIASVPIRGASFTSGLLYFISHLFVHLLPLTMGLMKVHLKMHLFSVKT